MDPFKVLQTAKTPVVNQSDVDKLRAKAKKLFKRYLAEKKKFEAKKVIEAFDMIKRQMKQGEYKILGRSRKERELDKHFNHQSKEIKKNKDLRRMLRHEARGGKRMHLRGDKEKIAAPRKKRKKRVAGPRTTQEMNVLRTLGRIQPHLDNPVKFPKAMDLLFRWVQADMNMENFEHVFLVLQGVVETEFITSEADAREVVNRVFRYVLNYFSKWFLEAEERRMLSRHWNVATLLACQCYTDDAFVLSKTIANLTEVLEMFREKRALVEAAEEEQEAGLTRRVALIKSEGDMEAKKFFKLSPKEDQAASGDEKKEEMKEELDDDEDEDDDYKDFGDFGDFGDDDIDDKDGLEDKTDVKLETGASTKTLDRTSSKLFAATSNVTSIDLDLDAKSEISSAESAADAVEVDDGSSDSVGILEEEISLSDGCSDEGSDCAEEAEVVIFAVPSTKKSILHIREKFVDRCLTTLFQNRGPLWARGKIDAFFQEVYYKKDLFSSEQQQRIEAWQARIKVMQKEKDRALGEANNPLEAHRPVVDSRETRTIMDSDANSWAAKQTFDARDRFGGSKTLR
mmetsp:Transcript_35654/g.81730  ORF Transcript_35654/g.81730 Transcript_35654/m.81730 type:complete len:569 (+) Transcript_35654:47-1753(+)